MANGETALLDYASPRSTREPWGPVVFRPSRRSLVLLALTALAALWLALRHEPWRRVGTIPADQTPASPFTRDGQLLTIDSRAGVNLYDPATTRRVRNVLPSVDITSYRYFPLGGGEQLLALPYVDRVALLYDVQSGRVVERLPNPDGLGSRLVAVAPDAPRVVTYWTGGNRRPPTYGLLAWDLRTAGHSDPVTLGELPRYDSTAFSPDGARLLGISGSFTGAAAFGLFDGRTFARVRQDDLPFTSFVYRSGFADDGRFWLLGDLSPGPQSSGGLAVQIRSAHTGESLDIVPLSPTGKMVGGRDAAVSGDLRVLAAHQPTRSPSGALLFFDLNERRTIGLRHDPFTRPIRFFPGSQRLLAADDAGKRLAILSPSGAQPLAVMPVPDAQGPPSSTEVSPDGRTIAAPVGPTGASLAILRPAGWDCPESPYGAFAFPQMWLTAAFLTALTLSLLADARRARPPSVARPVSPLLIGGLALIALPLTAHALLAACLGRWVRTPAPLLLLLAIGLATHARAWRAIAVILLAAVLPLLA